jgi:serine/threonine-protein kinase
LVSLCERTVIAGKYELLRELASGGMGSVWVARHLALDEDVAIKFMRPGLPETTEARARFAREARAAARLRSPHVVQVLDHGVDDDVPYLVMELLVGEHLGDRLRRVGRLPPRALAVITEQVARALTRAHNAGIVHRDLKPANVFLAQVDDEETAKVLDFGIAKNVREAEGEVTSTDVLMGSPQYMSPEQARGARDLDHRADLWSLGAILFRAVTGQPAFEGASAVDVILQVCTGPQPLPSRVMPDAPPELDAFFARALDRDPARRFLTAREMAGAFRALATRLDAPAGWGVRPRAISFPVPAPDDSDTAETLIHHRIPRAPLPRIEVPASIEAPASKEIHDFVERAFDALTETHAAALPTPRSPGAAPPAIRLARDVPETTVPMLRRLGVVPGGSVPPDPVSSGDRWLAAPAVRRGAVASLIDQGFTALRRGERDTARRAWREALEMDPDNRLLASNLRRLDAMARGGE